MNKRLFAQIESIGRKAAYFALALWFLSTCTLLAAQIRHVGDRIRYPDDCLYSEIPGDDPQSVAAVIETCRQVVKQSDILGVIYSRHSVVEHFLAFRLAYMLYPIKVAECSYDGFRSSSDEEMTPRDAVEQACRYLQRYKPNVLLVFSPDDIELKHARIIGRLADYARIYEVVDL